MGNNSANGIVSFPFRCVVGSYSSNLTEEQVRLASEAVVDAILFLRDQSPNAVAAADNCERRAQREKLIRAVMIDPSLTGWLLADGDFQVH